MTLLRNRSIISFRTATNFSIFSLFLIFGFTILSIFAPIFGSNATNNSTQELAAEINPVISLSAPTELSFNINPTAAGVFDSKELTVNISTNAIKGYELYFSSEDEQTNMKHTTPSITQSISSTFTGSLTSTNMQNNTWGYSLNNTDFKSIPKKTEQVKLKDLNTYPTPAERTQSIYFGVKADTTLPSGTYEKNVVFTAIAHANPPKPQKTLYRISTMQQMTSEICAATTTPNKTATALDTDGSHAGDPNYVPTKTLVDTRDNNTYTVSKLADGKCWMTQNLRIAGKTITPADSDVTANYTIPDSSISGFDSGAYEASNAYLDSDGGLYKWYTATAGTGAYSSGNTTVSICPKGWRLPTGGNSGEFQTLYNNYPSSSALRSDPVNLTLSGSVYNSSRYDQGSNGYYWSSTAHSNKGVYAYDLFLTASIVYPTYYDGKNGGRSVRCIAR